MGISVEVFRLRIGVFNAHVKKEGSGSSSNSPTLISSFGLCFLRLSVAAICMLLLISGVEPNPGPGDFLCKYCKLSLQTSSLYCEHIKIHSLWKNFAIPCCFCKRNLKNSVSFESHLSRFHRAVRVKPSLTRVEVLCPIATCAVKLDSRDQYMKHMSNHLKKGESFQCCLGVCKSTFHDKRKHQIHMYRSHPAATFCEFRLDSTASEALFESFYEDEDCRSDSGEGDNQERVLDEKTATDDPYPEYIVKDEIARFYLKLEGEHLLPTATVQDISTEIKRLTEFSHHFLKNSLKQELSKLHIPEQNIAYILSTVFKSDPVFNVHHKNEDLQHLATDHLRNKFWRSRFPYVEPQEIFLCQNEAGKKRVAQYVSIRETLQHLNDERIKEMVLQSFRRQTDTSVLTDFTDGSAYAAHQCEHHDGKCLQLLLFEDAFDFTAFGPTTGVHKPIGFYSSLGNIPAEYRSKVDLIQLAYMVLEKDTQPTDLEEIDGKDVLMEALKPLLDGLEDLKVNGIELNGETIPVCLLNLIGDSLGQHTMGGFVRSFSAEFFCRFCPISKTQFLDKPYEVKPLRCPEEYDHDVIKASALYAKRKREALATAKKTALRKAKQVAEKVASRTTAPASKSFIKTMLSKSALKRVCAVNFRGVKYRQSPFNTRILKFHVASPALAPCLGHDLFEGIFKCVIARILNYFANEKSYFDLKTLNRRIKSFKCKGRDALDPPKPLKTLDELSGNAVQNWNLVRLLPFMIGDLIMDKEDPVWQVYLQLKEITEYVCAPKISLVQVAYLKSIIRSYLSNLQSLGNYFPKCLIPKQHFLCHYPDLIVKFGPLIRLFTLRFESKHVFFKRVARACRSFVNITFTLARKYMCKFAYDHSTGIIPADVIYDPTHALFISSESLSLQELECLPENFCFERTEFLKSVMVKGILYERGDYLVLGSEEDTCTLIVGRIDYILLNDSNEVAFLLEEKEARNTFDGFYEIENHSIKGHRYHSHVDLPDYYPLPVYNFLGASCLTLKHSHVSM